MHRGRVCASLLGVMAGGDGIVVVGSLVVGRGVWGKGGDPFVLWWGV